MKLTKKEHLNKTGKVIWIDAIGYTNESLKHVLKCGFAVKETIGKICWIGKIGKHSGVVIQTEQCDGDDDGDYTIVPKLWVVGFIEMEVKL